MKINQRLKEILLEKEWGKGVLRSIVLGVAVSLVILLFSGNVSYALLWGGFSAYMALGAFISTLKSQSRLFEKINIGLGIALAVAGILGLIFWSEIKIIGTPILIIGIVIAVIASLGQFSAELGEAMSLDDSYDY